MDSDSDSYHSPKCQTHAYTRLENGCSENSAKKLLTKYPTEENNKHVICRPRSVRIGKNCALGLCPRTQNLWHSFSQYGSPGRQITYISSHVKRSPSLWLQNKSRLFHWRLYNKQNITCPLVDVNFIFSWSTRYRVKHEDKIHIHAWACTILYLNGQLLERAWWTKSRALIGYPSGQGGAFLPARDYALCPASKIFLKAI